MFSKKVLDPLLNSFAVFSIKNAFCIAEKFYTYEQLSQQISKIRKAIQNSTFKSSNIGIIANDDIETYATIFAIWFEGLAYVPLHPNQPISRNMEIIAQAEIDLIITSSSTSISNVEIIQSSLLEYDETIIQPNHTSENLLAYILFTSGSTGKPKGVTISRKNIGAFVEAFWDLGYSIDENDRILQPFDLTFDLSVMSYLIPLLKGACVYTIPLDQIKYSYIAQLLDDHSLTVALMVPSTIRYLRPYFDEIDLPALRYNLFCGEALPLELVNEWSKCIPNAFIDNVYGPTEDTIFCTHYRYSRDGNNKSYNGILSIGKSMTSGEMIVINEGNQEVAVDERGELCLSGNQLTPGYWKNPEKNIESFFTDKEGKIFYKTGDICYKDSDGDFMYSGRLDHQVKVQGYRIELGEIEHHAVEFLKGQNAVALPCQNISDNTEIILVVEGEQYEKNELLNFLKSKMPSYMVPSKIFSVETFPLNSNGKIDRKILKKMIPE
jgi:D-alanine--poly(phosphoribitol) ligase subunit 1